MKGKLLVGLILATVMVAVGVSSPGTAAEGPMCEKDPFDHDRSDATDASTSRGIGAAGTGNTGETKSTSGATVDKDVRPSLGRELRDSARERVGAMVGGAVGGAVAGSRAGPVGLGLGALGGAAAGAISSGINEIIRNNVHEGAPPPADDLPPGME